MSRNIISIEDLIGDEHYADLRSGSVKIRPLGVGEIAGMTLTWPGIGAVLRGSEVRAETLASISRDLPDAVPYMLSLSLGMGGWPGIPMVRRMSATDQMTVLNGMYDITFPDGVGPFFQEVDKLMPPVAPPEARGNPEPEHPDEVKLEDLQRP